MPAWSAADGCAGAGLIFNFTARKRLGRARVLAAARYRRDFKDGQEHVFARRHLRGGLGIQGVLDLDIRAAVQQDTLYFGDLTSVKGQFTRTKGEPKICTSKCRYCSQPRSPCLTEPS